MRALAELKALSQVDPIHLHRIFFVDHFCLSAAGIMALINLFPGIIIPLGNDLPAGTLRMNSACVAMTLCAVLDLYLSEATQSRLMKGVGIVFGSFTSAIATVSLLAISVNPPLVVRRILIQYPVALREGSLQFSYGAFLLVGSAILFGWCKGNGVARIANALTLILSFVVFALALGFIFRGRESPDHLLHLGSQSPHSGALRS